MQPMELGLGHVQEQFTKAARADHQQRADIARLKVRHVHETVLERQKQKQSNDQCCRDPIDGPSVQPRHVAAIDRNPNTKRKDR